MPTINEVLEWYASLGLDVPRVIVEAWLGTLDGLEQCMVGAGYSQDAQELIVLHLLALYGLSAGNRYLSSQSAPSGASRSFRFAIARDAWRGQLGMLRLLDKSGCTDAFIPAEPGAKRAGIGVFIGGCKH